MKTLLFIVLSLLFMPQACSLNNDKNVIAALKDIVEEKDSSGEVTRRTIRAQKEHLPAYLKLLNKIS